MQVLERTGEDRDKRGACHADSAAHAHAYEYASGQSASPSGSTALSAQAEEELAIRASHITAAAVAAAAVTAAVVTAAEAPAEAREAQAASAPAAAPARQPRGLQGAEAATTRSQPSQRGAWRVSLLTLAIIAAALWVGQQW
ncbi:phage tail protein, partial [Herbaspirillum seropedicae]